MSYQNLSNFGQIQAGDKLIIIDNTGKVKRVIAKDVLHAGTEKEEILINISKNIYFIVSMFLNGSSWAKAVAFRSHNQ